MKMNHNELMKIFDFILENKNIVIADNQLFSRDTLTTIRDIVKGKISNTFQLTEEQKQLIIDTFMNSNNAFTEDTPNLIIENEECFKVAIERDLNSVNFIENFTPEQQISITSKALKYGFVLKENSPDFFKDNYDIALNSIKVDVASADFINWDSMTNDEKNNLIDVAINNNYELSKKSNIFLKENIKIVLVSIKKDMDKVQYLSSPIENHPEVFKYLLLNGYHYDTEELVEKKFSQILDSEVLGYCFKQLDVYGCDDEKYIARFNTIFSDAMKKLPTIHTFESVFQAIVESQWREYRDDNVDNYTNIFGKICNSLRTYDYFDVSVRALPFSREMESTLDDKYDDLYNAMQEYFNIYHSDTPKKLEKMQPYQDVIAKLSALYVAKSKENYKKERLHALYGWLQSYFTLRKDHPIFVKKVTQIQKKKIFKKLYLDDDKETWIFINNIIQSYIKYASIDSIRTMINGFVIDGYSKINDILGVPENYSDYEQYEEALKLINRLNSGYIQYDGPELHYYKDIIKYDEMTKKYFYAGITFDEADLTRFNEYRNKARIFEKIKKDITLKVSSIDVYDKIDRRTLRKLGEELPFTDEYFECNKKLLDFFDLKTMYKLFMDRYKYKVENFTDDESFTNLYNLLINNGIVWLLLFMTLDRDYSYRLSNNGINVDNIRELIDNMKIISDFSKIMAFDTTKYNELQILKDMVKYADAESIAILGKDIIEKLCRRTEYTSGDAKEIVSIAKELVCQMVKRDKSTVPFVKGETTNYKYSVYDSQDESILLAGINTNACFRIDGNDNDFLHYCALDKNGVVIKITDLFGNFIARASGFRNGNCVFFNQLRTIYDENVKVSVGAAIRYDIIETFKIACEDIVNTSQQSPDEIDEIDYVIVTCGYSLQDLENDLPDDVTTKIGYTPMDIESEDWEYFVNNTANLRESKAGDGFTTDYGSYCLICMASFEKNKTLKPEDIKPKNVEAVYERIRNKIMATDKPDITTYRKVNRINAIKSYFANEELKIVSVPEDSTVFIGDNWYIISQNGSIINSCVLDFDSKAKIEYEITKQELTKVTLNLSQHQINIEKNLENIPNQSSSEGYIEKQKIIVKKP